MLPAESSHAPSSPSLVRKDTGGVQKAVADPLQGIRQVDPKRKRGASAGGKSTHDLETFTTSWARHKNHRRPKTKRPTAQQFQSLGLDRRLIHQWMVALKAKVRRARIHRRKLSEEARILGRPSDIMASRLKGCSIRIRVLKKEIAEYMRCCRQWRQALVKMLKSSQEHRKWELAHTCF